MTTLWSRLDALGLKTPKKSSKKSFRKSSKSFRKLFTLKKVVLYDISDAALDKAKVSIEKSVARVAKKMEADKGEQFIAETLG